MAPSKRKADDDFILTLSDNEAGPVEEEITEAAPPKKKSKTAKKAKRSKTEDVPEEEPEGIWGQNDDDDGAMDSDFEFMVDNAVDIADADFEGWGFDGAKKGMKGAEKTGVDLDEIIRRRIAKKEGKTNGTAQVAEEAPQEAEQSSEDEDGDIDLDDEEDEVLADDAFGMAVASDAEESQDDEMPDIDDEEEEEDDDAASDNDSVATPVGHPDDDAGQGSSDDEEEDEEEAAKREAFFAPEEPAKPGKKDSQSSFQTMSLSRPILRGLTSVGFTKPTPIQAKTIPIALMGKDVVGGAVTGSGKTAAFIVPILERLLYRPKKVPTSRVVILTPTRELAIQCHAVATKLASHTDIKFCLAVGGLSLKVQEAELRLRPDVIIGTPGRFIDHMRNSASFAVETVEILVLDEADRMLEDGFADELNEILTTLPKSRQTMLFSATMTSSVDQLIRVGLNKPVRIMVDSQKRTVGTLTQEFVRLRPGREDKRLGYLLYICKTLYTERVIIFFRQKKIAHQTRIIFGLLGLSCAELHGSMNQAQRIASVENFRDGKVSFLLATDLASRGLDIKGVDTVINYEAPQSLEIYLHRVGRTARAGRSGVAVTLAAEPDRKVVKAAVKAGKAQGAKISSRIIEPAKADEWQDKIDDLEDEVEMVMQEEKEEKQMAQVEMQVKKGENMIQYEDDIKSRPKRTWFETEKDKKAAKEAGRAELNGVRDSLKKKHDGGKLSNKDKKKLDAKAARTEGRSWKKGRAERDGKGAVLALKKDKKKAKPRGPPGKGPKKGAANGRRRRRRTSVVNTSQDKVAPFRPFRRFGHPHHKQSLFRYLFPHAVREHYRERLLNFRLDTLPYYKHRFQSRIYRYLVDRQQKRREQTRLVDLVARHSRRLLLGPPSRTKRRRQGRSKDVKRAEGAEAKNMSQWGYRSGGYPGGYPGDGSDYGGEPYERERGARRKKLAAMAGSVYRAGVAAASEIREQYSNTRIRGVVNIDDSNSKITIPGSFPDVAIVVKGDEQMVLFPSYAKRHIRQFDDNGRSTTNTSTQANMNDEDYWRQEWARMEDKKAIVDVDVRGWVYSPQKGAMTRRNRMLIGLARRLSGIPAPTVGGPEAMTTFHEDHEDLREQQKIAREAEQIERRGQAEKEAAVKGSYSEEPREEDSDADSGRYSPHRTRSGSRTPISAPTSPTLSARPSINAVAELTETELAVANANLMARLGPFMTTPLVQLPITIFFYNDETSQSRTVTTNDAGHFSIRAALDFVPTHVRVLANESLSATEPVQIIENTGISLISDIDDTIKRSSISLGAREIFRNTFIRDLGDLTVDGVREWYGALHDMGVSLHYCSNSPWQLFPVIATFFRTAGLPPGSLHLKQYSGMLQGIFEPVAERKKGTLEKILRDFPERKFLLVGDSGEADLEVYTDLVVANPKRILAVFIRDVTTPEKAGYFDAGFDPAPRRTKTASSRIRVGSGDSTGDDPSQRPILPPRLQTEPAKNDGPSMGTLIDFSDEPEEMNTSESQNLAQLMGNTPLKPNNSSVDLPGRKVPPPRPAKPAALRGGPSDISPSGKTSISARSDPTPPGSRKPTGPMHPLSQMLNSSDPTLSSNTSLPKTRDAATTPASKASSNTTKTTTSSASAAGTESEKPPPPPPRRRGTPSSILSLSPRLLAHRRTNSNSDLEGLDALPPAATGGPTVSTGGTNPNIGPINKKLDLWRRRLERAHDTLDQHGVKLYTWRRGEDVIHEAIGIVKEAMGERTNR